MSAVYRLCLRPVYTEVLMYAVSASSGRTTLQRVLPSELSCTLPVSFSGTRAPRQGPPCNSARLWTCKGYPSTLVISDPFINAGRDSGRNAGMDHGERRRATLFIGSQGGVVANHHST